MSSRIRATEFPHCVDCSRHVMAKVQGPHDFSVEQYMMLDRPIIRMMFHAKIA